MAGLLRRVAQHGYGWLRTGVLPALTAPIGLLSSPRQVVWRWPEIGPVPLGPRVAVFVHFDTAGQVGPRVLGYLGALRAQALDIAFVTNAGHLSEAAIASLRPLCAIILIRRNVGYDFGAWRDALEQADLPRSDTSLIILANDSVFGPLRPLSAIMARIDPAQADIWGMTDSFQSRYHLQSYFLAIHAAVFASPAWAKFWRGVRPAPSKHWIIRHYEIGFTRAMQAAGYRCRAIWPYGGLIQAIAPIRARPVIGQILRNASTRRLAGKVSRRSALNPCSDLWRELLAQGFPFIKRELLRDNPGRVPDVADWRMASLPHADPAALTTVADELTMTGETTDRRHHGGWTRR